MSRFRFLIVRFVRRRQHTSVCVGETILFRPIQGSTLFSERDPGATRSATLRACPWLSYFAPLALTAERRVMSQVITGALHKKSGIALFSVHRGCTEKSQNKDF